MSEEDVFDEAQDWLDEKINLELRLEEAHEQLEEVDEQVNKLNERVSALRTLNLEFGAAIGRIWQFVAGSEQPESSDAAWVAQRIIDKLANAEHDLEISDAQVEALGGAIYGPAVVWDREKVRSGLALALQTR